MRLSKQQKAAFNSVAANRAYMRRTGLTYAGQRLWTEAETATLKRLHPDYDALGQALSPRTRRAIEHKARHLGLVRSRRQWSDAEFALMKPLYIQGAPVRSILDRLLGKTPEQVWSKAAKRGIRRPRRVPCITGFGAVDAVRRRAFDLHISMKELDEMAGGGEYFRRPRRVNWAAVQRVLPLLGGRAAVVWHAA